MKLPVIKIETILYTTDLSENAFYAFAYAVSLANRYGAKLNLLHVVEEQQEVTRYLGYLGEDRWKEIQQRHYSEAREALIGKLNNTKIVEEALTTFCETAKAGCADQPVETGSVVIRIGNPVEQILAAAREMKADMIVMGTHGHGTLTDVMIGSTARRVLRRSKIPVLAVRLPDLKR
jgi:nucleotide-binding universal stress UspA family protein